jgi:transcriptional regulator PpsR
MDSIDGVGVAPDVARDSLSKLLQAAADIIVVLDPDGRVRSVAIADPALERDINAVVAWPGRLWTVCVELSSRPKVDALIAEALEGKPIRWIHINHPWRPGSDIPVLYAAIRVGPETIVAVGRDLRATSLLQQRLIDTQQAMERDYVRVRHLETRFRLLFQTTSEAVLIVDMATLRPVEINPAMRDMIGDDAKNALRAPLDSLFAPASRPAVMKLLAAGPTSGRPETTVSLAARPQPMLISVAPFVQDNAAFALIRLAPAAGAAGPSPNAVGLALLKAFEDAPDGIVLTQPDGIVLSANAAFRNMAQLSSEEQARGRELDHWLGRPGVDLNVLGATLRQRGTVSLFATTLRGEYGATTDVEISAVASVRGDETFHAYLIRNVDRRLPADLRVGRDVPRSVDQLTELIGRVPLKDLVREATDMIERLCIVAALEMTGDNRASAAELLGLSRQSLYVKLRRHGLGDLTEIPDDHD